MTGGHTTSSSTLIGLTLVVQRPDAPEHEIFVQHGLTIGRAASNAICVPDDGVDPIHVRIIRNASGGFEAVAESASSRLTDETTGEEIECRALNEGSRFRVGSATFVCRKVASKPSVVVTSNPWEVRCPRCHGSLSDVATDTRRCPDCELPIHYFESTNGEAFRGWLPRRVGPYRIRGFVGQGGMGAVLKGLHEKSELPAAIKLPLIPAGRDEEWLRRFDAELKTLQKVTHRNVVRLQEGGRDKHMAWLATDWIEGESLAHMLETARANQKRLKLDTIRDLMGQITAGLAYLHGRGIVHRDLKPDNILIARDGLVKLTDMGLARTIDDSPQATAMTRTGSVVGTQGYMAPEQMEGGAVTAATDIYALGVIWYEMLTGHKPLGRYVDPGYQRSDAPSLWTSTLSSCLAYDISSRPSLQSVHRLMLKLDVASHSTTGNINSHKRQRQQASTSDIASESKHSSGRMKSEKLPSTPLLTDVVIVSGSWAILLIVWSSAVGGLRSLEGLMWLSIASLLSPIPGTLVWGATLQFLARWLMQARIRSLPMLRIAYSVVCVTSAISSVFSSITDDSIKSFIIVHLIAFPAVSAVGITYLLDSSGTCVRRMEFASGFKISFLGVAIWAIIALLIWVIFFR